MRTISNDQAVLLLPSALIHNWKTRAWKISASLITNQIVLSVQLGLISRWQRLRCPEKDHSKWAVPHWRNGIFKGNLIDINIFVWDNPGIATSRRSLLSSAVSYDKSCELTHLSQVPHIGVNESGHHWFRYWRIAYSAPSHYLNNYWAIDKLYMNHTQSNICYQKPKST